MPGRIDQSWAAAVNAAFPVAALGGSDSYGEMYLSTAVETVIAADTTPVKALGTTTVGDVNNFTAVGNNRLRYDGSKTAWFKVNCQLGATAGNSLLLTASIAVDGTNIPASTIVRKTGVGADVGAWAIGHIVQLAEGSYVELFVGNNTSNANLTVENMTMTVIGIDD